MNKYIEHIVIKKGKCDIHFSSKQFSEEFLSKMYEPDEESLMQFIGSSKLEAINVNVATKTMLNREMQ